MKLLPFNKKCGRNKFFDLRNSKKQLVSINFSTFLIQTQVRIQVKILEEFNNTPISASEQVTVQITRDEE